MTHTGLPWLTIITFAPALGAILLVMLPRVEKDLLRNVALGISLLTFAFSIPLLTGFSPNFGGFQLTQSHIEDVSWISVLGVRYRVGVDGISLFLVLLTTFLTPICILSTYRAVEDRVKEYMIALLVLETGMLGALVALDVFLFYVFWELMLIPMYLIIGVWGGPRRRYAAVKFFLYTMVGSVLMLIAIMYVYLKGAQLGGVNDFSIERAWEIGQSLSPTEQGWLFAAFFLAFAIKVPLFPVHTWLPDAHVEAPTAGSVILAGVLLKLGTFGIVRYAMPMFPQALFAFAPWIAILSIIGIIYGALMAIVQKDVKSLVAYSSISHLGFVVLGLVALSPQGITGGVFQMLAHGISTGGLFLAIGILYEQRHKRGIDDYGGVASKLPVFSTFFVIIVLASVGLPGLCGFVGEYLILFGTAVSDTLHFGAAPLVMFPGAQSEACMGPGWAVGSACAGPEATTYIFTALAASGVILAAVYLLRMVQKVLFGKVVHPEVEELRDLNKREVAYLLPIIVMAFVMGIFPGYFTDRIEPSVQRLTITMEREYADYVARHALDEQALVGLDRPDVRSPAAIVGAPDHDGHDHAGHDHAGHDHGEDH